jgi:hypothetical protein
MSKLKTLKAIQECANDKIDTITEEPCFFGFNDALDIFSEVKRRSKEEAKKWIEVANKEKELEIRGGSKCYSYERAEAVIEFIKYFFNLEEEK